MEPVFWNDLVFPWLHIEDLLTCRLVCRAWLKVLEGSGVWFEITKMITFLRPDEQKLGWRGMRLSMLRRWDGQELFVDE